MTAIDSNRRILTEIIRTSTAVRNATCELRAHFPVVWAKPRAHHTAYMPCLQCGRTIGCERAEQYVGLCPICFDAEYADRDLIETPADPQGVTLEAREETEPC